MKRHPVLTAAVLSFIIFFLISIFFHFTYGADDYLYMSQVYSDGGLSLHSFGPYIYRVPLWAFMTWGFFHLTPFLPIHVLIYLTICIFAIAFAFLAMSVYETLSEAPLPPQTVSVWIILTVIFALFPNHYEILYWPTCMTYVPGLLFLAMAFRCRRFQGKIIWLTASFLTSEMYILPALAFAQLPMLQEKRLSLRNMCSRSRDWIAALFLSFGFRGLIFAVSRLRYRYDLSFIPQDVLAQMKSAVLQTWTIHFYKTNYLLSSMYLGTILLGFYLLMKNKTIHGRLLKLFLVTSVVTTAIYWIFGHPAARGLFGAQVYILTVLIYLFTQLAPKAKFVLPALFVVFLAQDLYIYSIKDKNYHVLDKRTAELIERIEKCPYPCVLVVERLNSGLKRDWVLPPDYWDFYLRWINLKYSPDKSIVFRLEK